MRTKSKPSPYTPLSFRIVRALSLVSAVIVTSVIVYFSIQLHQDGFKVPWTFIIVLLASLLSLIVLLLTSIISCCTTLSPILNVIMNVPLLILWIIAFALLAWNMSGMLIHSCSIQNWAVSEGVMVCQLYKTLFAFVVIGTLLQIAQIVLDIRARRHQNRLGAYNKMRSSQDIKIDTFQPNSQTNLRDAHLHEEQEFRDEIPAWRPGQPQNTHSYGHDDGSSISLSNYSQSHTESLHQTHYNAGDYMHQETHYDSGSYPTGNYAHQDYDRRY